MFTKNKVFAYENSDGDKGIIIAKSIDKAKKIFHKNIQNARFLRSKDTNPNRFNECWAEYQAKNGIRLA